MSYDILNVFFFIATDRPILFQIIRRKKGLFVKFVKYLSKMRQVVLITLPYIRPLK